MRSQLLVAALWLLSLASTPARAADGPGASIGQVELASGLTARFEYHFDRNALRDSRRIGNSLVALTRSGNLVRFDLATRRPNLEMFATVPATCIGQGEGDSLLVGLEDGRICRSDPTTLLLTEVARLEGKPQWVGFAAGSDGKQGGLVAVVEMSKWVDMKGYRYQAKSSTVHEAASGKDFSFEQAATTCLLDSKRRLWLGGDRGEWGGWCACVDLATGVSRTIDGAEPKPGQVGLRWSGIYGFVELRDGQVWAHGGMMHMGSTEAFICRVDGAKTGEIMRSDNRAAMRAAREEKAPPKPDRPWLPITHMLEERDGNLLVFSYNDLYRTDPDMRRWTKLREIRIRYSGGRPDAMGTYPSLKAVHLLDGVGARVVCATQFDGYALIEPGKTSMLKLPGQLEAEDVTRIANTAEGTIFLAASDADPPWRFRDGAWSIARLVPPLPPELKEPGEDRVAEQKWDRSHLFVGPGGAITTVNADGIDTRWVARWRGIRAEVLGRDGLGLDPAACFMTPDGSLWNAHDGGLLRFSAAEWVDSDSRPSHSPGSPKDVGQNLRALNEDGPPWLILDPDNARLLNLVDGPKVEAPKLRKIEIVEGGLPLHVRDAIPWTRGELLLATDGGLRRFEVASGKALPSPVPEPEPRVTSLCRDGLGRVWLGGEGLWVVDADGKRLHDGGAIPMIGNGQVVAIAADPKRRDGVILSLGARGVAFVQVANKP